MQFPGDATSLRENRTELALHMLDANRISQPRQQNQRETTHQIEPSVLIKTRRQSKRQGRASFVAGSIGIARGHPKTIGAGTQVRVERLAARARVHPVAIEALQLVAKRDAL